MEFIHKMKTREFIEMSLKTAIALFAAFIAIILMEGMIYGIELNAQMNYGDSQMTDKDLAIAYCIEKEEDQYFVMYYHPTNQPTWSSSVESPLLTKEECLALKGDTAKEVYLRAPTAFEFTIESIDYIIISVFVAAIAGFFVYKFIALARDYGKIERHFKETGEIELLS